MGLPTLTKTWQWLVNLTLTDLGSSVTDQKQFLVALVNALTGVTTGWLNSSGGSIASPTGLWQPRGSSNGVTASMLAVSAAGPGTNLWTGTSSIVQAASGTAHSWVVLRQTGIAANYEVCIDCVGSFSGPTVTVTVSPSAGFGSAAAGSVTARPTATDEVQVVANSGTLPSSAANIRLHALVSSDGSATYVVACAGGVCIAFFAFVAPNAAVSGWSNPSVSLWGNSGSVATSWPTVSNLWTSANLKGLLGSTTFSAFASGEAANGTLLSSFLTAPGAADGNYKVPPIGVLSSTSGAADRYGVMPDLFWGQTALATGTGYPSGTAPQFAQFGAVVVPWPLATIATS